MKLQIWKETKGRLTTVPRMRASLKRTENASMGRRNWASPTFSTTM